MGFFFFLFEEWVIIFWVIWDNYVKISEREKKFNIFFLIIYNVSVYIDDNKGKNFEGY